MCEYMESPFFCLLYLFYISSCVESVWVQDGYLVQGNDRMIDESIYTHTP